jgi:hypothetical protein
MLYRGLEALVAYLRARREVLYSHFLLDWQRLERTALNPALLDDLRGATLAERSETTT